MPTEAHLADPAKYLSLAALADRWALSRSATYRLVESQLPHLHLWGRMRDCPIGFCAELLRLFMLDDTRPPIGSVGHAL